MSTISQVSQNGSPAPSKWDYVSKYVIPPCAAGIGIVPSYYFFCAKTSLQLGEPVPRFSFKFLVDGIKAAPNIGGLVGTQIIFQNILEEAIKERRKRQHLSEDLDFQTKIGISTVVAIVSSPALVTFNGHTMGWSAKQSRKFFVKNPKLLACVLAQETFFLTSLSICDALSFRMKSTFGDNKAVKVCSDFSSGAIGSLFGHAANTTLTLWQKGIKVEKASQLAKGALTKAVAVGVFSVCYNEAKEFLKTKSQGFFVFS
ncbi:MAG: hypothetical protein H0W88_07300 [Parachlamydiaceae bacterium]|nr:hypothetical protein [Parachlamydiaceae bacterium]